MPQHPLVSIIVPVYKTEEHLKKCLQSVANQSFTDWECIVVNDGSDQPGHIDTVTNKHLRQKGRVIHQENKGVYHTRNTAIKASLGKFIVCLDPDDYLHPDFLKKTTAVMEKHMNTSVVYCWTQYVGNRTDSLRPSEIHLFWLLQRNYITITSLFKKEVWSEIGGFDETMKIGLADWEFWIRTGLAGYTFTCVPEILFYYKISQKSMNTEATAKRFQIINYIRHKHHQIYFLPLHTLFSYPRFRGIAKTALVRFWVTGLFFRYVPFPIRKIIFEIYRHIKD